MEYVNACRSDQKEHAPAPKHTGHIQLLLTEPSEKSDSPPIKVSVELPLSNVSHKPVGIVANYLLDSEKHRPRAVPFSTAIQEMGVRSIRYPYGFLANNYLWTTAPYADAIKGLMPRVASKHEAPSEWRWAVDSGGTIVKSMDFDEYIQLCKANGIEPLVVLNVMSHKYKEGPSYEQLKEAAVEWVKYANVTRKYGVKYWQLGNEQDLHKDILPLEEYMQLYVDFVSAMKAVDPTIKAGPGLLGNEVWIETLLTQAVQETDFMAVHQYARHISKGGFEAWQNSRGDALSQVDRLERLIGKSAKPDMEMLITETGATAGVTWVDGGKPDTYRALLFFEMAAHMIQKPNVKYIYFWSTHSPWNGEHNNGGLPNALDMDNQRKPNGEIIRILNQSLNETMVQTDRVRDHVRAYASYSASEGRLTIFLLNKDTTAGTVNVEFPGFTPNTAYERWVFKGDGPYDLTPDYKQSGSAAYKENILTTTLDPVSLTIIKLTRKQQ